MDEGYNIPPAMRDLARIWGTEVSAIRPHLLDIDLANPFTSKVKRRTTLNNYSIREVTHTVNTPKQACISIETPTCNSAQTPVEITTQEPTFHTSHADTNSLPDSFTELLMEAEHAILTMDCHNPTPLDGNIPLRFPRVGMGYQEDTVESCVRASTGEPPIVTLRPYERHWKRSGVYQWRKPASLGNREVLLEGKPKYQLKRTKVMKNTASKERIKKNLIVSLNFKPMALLQYDYFS